jgi:peptidase E
MKTKFIIHGGFAPGKQQENDAFFQEILNTAPQEAKVLLVYFAKEEDRIDKNKKEDIEHFNKNKGDKTIIFEVASGSMFTEQVQKADIIYFHGGHTVKLLEALKNFPNLKGLLGGKIVAGDSAGTNVLCSVFYSLKRGVGEGFGIIPIKVICHYKEENKDKLREIRPDLETIILPEYQFIVYEY